MPDLRGYQNPTDHRFSTSRGDFGRFAPFRFPRPGNLGGSREIRAQGRSRRHLHGPKLSTEFIFNKEWNSLHLRQLQKSRIVTSANSGPLAKARRRSCRIRSALRRDQIRLNPSSPPLPVTSELIGVGAASFLTPRLDPCSPGVFWPRPTRRAAIRNHATSLARSRLFRR
jgi:hypothetical protein